VTATMAAAPHRPSCVSSERRSIRTPSGPTTCATPNTSRRFEITLPASDPLTTCGSALCTAKRAMISSGALPKLAFRKPPIPGPVCSAACSVASPISHASGMSAAHESRKSTTLSACVRKSIRIVMGARARSAQRILWIKARGAYRPVLEAVLFDWGDTLMQWAPGPGLLEEGHAAGFRALGREAAVGMTDRFRDVYLTSFFEPGVIEEIEYPSQVRRLRGEFAI